MQSIIFRNIFICVVKVRCEARRRDDPPLFALKALDNETFARKEPQKQNSTLDILDLARALENGSSEVTLHYLLHPFSEHTYRKNLDQ